MKQKSTKITITLSSRPHYTTIPLACALYDPHHDGHSAGSHAAGPWWGTQPHHTHPASAMYEDTTGQNTTTHHHSPPLLSAHNPNALLSIQQQQQQQTSAQSAHTPQSSQTNGSHTNGTVASAQSQQIVTPSAASDSPVSPPTGNDRLRFIYQAHFSVRHSQSLKDFIHCGWVVSPYSLANDTLKNHKSDIHQRILNTE